MNYGYNEDTTGWIEEKKHLLATALSNALCIPVGYVAGFGNLYIEVDGSYSGVRIRHMTQLTEKENEELVKKADEIYNEVMEVIENGNL